MRVQGYRRSRSTRLFAALPVAVLLAFGGAPAAQASSGAEDRTSVRPTSDDPPTFYADVLPILQESCQVCHRPGGTNLGGMIAPMSLVTYEETRPWAPMIAHAVAEGQMPPWHAHPRHLGTFRNERYLTDEQKLTIGAWAEAGAPAGDPADAPSAVSFDEIDANEAGWSIGTPDLVVTFDEPFLVGDHVHDVYENIPVFISEQDVPEYRWIRASEVIAGSHAVHHVISDLGGLAPGYEANVYPDGFGRLLAPGPRHVTFQMHYHKQPGPGTAVYDETAAGVIFYEEGDVIRHVVRTEPLGMFTFVIPAGEADYSMSTEYVFQEDSYILTFNPHMHLRGKAAEYTITYPDGESEVLLYVPNYDFNWQHYYHFREPVLAPEGSRLTLKLWWDNSAGNPHNPDPTVNVRWGQPTTDEMGFGFMAYTSAEPQNIAVGEPLSQELIDRSTGAGLSGLTPASLLQQFRRR